MIMHSDLSSIRRRFKTYYFLSSHMGRVEGNKQLMENLRRQDRTEGSKNPQYDVCSLRVVGRLAVFNLTIYFVVESATQL